MEDLLNWKSFSAHYHLYNDRYVQDVALLQRIQNTYNYPIILYSKSLREQMHKKFHVEPEAKERKRTICLQDLLSTAKSLNIRGNSWAFLNPPIDPKKMQVPHKSQIPSYKYVEHKTHNLGCLIPILALVALLNIPAWFMWEDTYSKVIYAIMWLPTILYFAHYCEVGVSDTVIRKKKLTKQEVENLENKALKEYHEEVMRYENKVREYDGLMAEYEKSLYEQTRLIDENSNRIIAAQFKQCLMSKTKIPDSKNAPQRGAYEDKFFYALMKELPTYIKIDKVLGFYFPDLVLFNGFSCPIDIEIDEPYEYKTKKEIHYIGCGDEDRNKFFSENNWFVIRFSEDQIKNHISECVSIVKAFARFIESGDTFELYAAEKIIYSIQEPRWSKEDARVMAIENYRTNNTL